MSHTPGPWSLLDESEIHHEGAMIANVMMVDDFPCLDQDDEALIAKVEAECHANARLIKAAPDLLAALKELLAAYPYEHTPECAAGIGRDSYDPAKCNGCAVSRARDAIAEAEGT